MSKKMKFLAAVLCALAATACATAVVVVNQDAGDTTQTTTVNTTQTAITLDADGDGRLDRDPDWDFVYLNGYRYDLRNSQPDAPRDLLVDFDPNKTSWQIIQFSRPLLRVEQEHLIAEYGMTLKKYVRNNAYIEYLTPAAGKRIERHPLFRARGAYHTAFKISKAIGKVEYVTEYRRNENGIRLIIFLWPNADASSVEDFVYKNGGRQIQQNLTIRKSDQQKTKTQAAWPISTRVTAVLPNQKTIKNLALLPEVEWIEEADEVTLSNPQTAAVVETGAQTGAILIDQPFRNRGLLGQGQIVGHIDGPIDPNNAYFQNPGKIIRHTPVAVAPVGPVTCGTDVGHGTHTAGTVAGNGVGLTNVGIAPSARLTHTDLSILNGGVPFNTLLSAASNDGARVHTNSFDVKDINFPDRYTALSADVDVFSWNNRFELVVLSTGNNDFDIDLDGSPDPMPSNPPWNSKNGLAVAATYSPPNQMNQRTGGIGPAKGRRKPEIYADGHDVLSAQAGSVAIEPSTTCTGSSMATPAIAAGAALVRQYFMDGFYPDGGANVATAFEPSGALLKAVLLNSTRDMTGVDHENGSPVPLNGYPTDLEGWGLAALDDTVYFSGDASRLNVWDIANNAGVGAGGLRTYYIWVQSNAPRLKITLAWMDSPPTSGTWGNATMPVNNNLDLIVEAPDGTQYFGNNYGPGAQSTPGGATDTMNNVEQFERTSPQPGPWKIHVRGAAVNQGPLQGYALVASGDLTAPGVIPVVVAPGAAAPKISITKTSSGPCKSDHYKFEFKQGATVKDTLKTEELDLPEVFCEVDDSNRYQIIKKPFKTRDKYVTFAVAANDKGRAIQIHTLFYAAGGAKDGIIEISAEPYNARLVSGSRQLQRISNISVSDTDSQGGACSFICVTFSVRPSILDISIAGKEFGKTAPDPANRGANAGGRYEVQISNSSAITGVKPI